MTNMSASDRGHGERAVSRRGQELRRRGQEVPVTMLVIWAMSK